MNDYKQQHEQIVGVMEGRGDEMGRWGGQQSKEMKEKAGVEMQKTKRRIK